MSPDDHWRLSLAAGQAERPKSRKGLVTIAIVAMMVTIALFGLGTWQVQRLFWKHALIERVDARVHAPAMPAPGIAEWPSVGAGQDEYRHVTVTGTFRHPDETLVQATTERGPGFWVMTPLVEDGGATVLINRGFVPPDKRDPGSRQSGNPAGVVTVTGLLRITEPGGGFLRSNAPSENRWYSRDVAAISAAKGLGATAPYFIDADASSNPGGLPVGGMTRIVFPDSHLVYAITWYALAIMLASATVVIGRREWRRAKPAEAP